MLCLVKGTVLLRAQAVYIPTKGHVRQPLNADLMVNKVVLVFSLKSRLVKGRLNV